jgi:hypothetical protein
VSDFAPLSADDQLSLDRQRDWVKGHFTHDADEKYAPIEGKLRVIDAILRSDWVEANEIWKLQSLGVAFGDAIVQQLLMDWVAVDDEFGRSAALNWPGTTILCSPITMISKRIERGEVVDVSALFDGMCSSLREMAFSGRYA